MKCFKSKFLSLCFVLLGFIIFAEPTAVKGLYSYKLNNGLSLFVAENHSVPLSYIEIAVRCGAYTQTEETNGLFHLYEHMMFKGNSLYKDAASVTKALSDLGVAEWNGTTDLECVNYYFTIPSEMTEKGLEFWNAAIRTPKMDETELENEKKVVLSEIKANFSNLDRIFFKAKNELLFSEAPYKLTTSGSEHVVQNATVKQLKEIQKRFYIPNNAAVFVGGDVEPDKVYAMVKKIFGSWKKGPDPFENKESNPDRLVEFTKNPFSKPVYAVMANDKISKDIAQIQVDYRGPDCYFDRDDTYPADILCDLMRVPNGYFKQYMCQDPLLFIPDTNYVGASYYTRKINGVYSFEAVVQNPNNSVAERSIYFADIIPKVVKAEARNANEKAINTVVGRLNDMDLWNQQTAFGILSALRFWWTVSDEDYYFTYNTKMSEVIPEDLLDFVERYFENKAPLVTVCLNPEVYESCKEDFKKNGFVVLNDEEGVYNE